MTRFTLKLQLLVFLSVINCISIVAQTNDKAKLKCCKVADFNITTGFCSDNPQSISHESFMALAPQSKLMDLNSKTNSGYNFYYISSVTGNTMLNINLGLKFINKQDKKYRMNPVLHLGISYASGIQFNYSSSYYKQHVFDTLKTPITGQTYFLDSMHSVSNSFQYSCEQIRFDANLIFRTNPAARFSLFAGIGINGGVSIKAETNIYRSEYDAILLSNSGNGESGGPNISSKSSYQNETWENKSNRVLFGYIPMGVDFRLGKKSSFWKQLHLFYEFRPGITMTNVPELKKFYNTSLMQGIGLRVEIQ